MNIKEKCEVISSNNKDVLQDVIEYIKNLFKIDEQELQSKTKYYLKELLYEVRKNNNEVVMLRLDCKQKEEDIQMLERASVKACSYEESGGKNTGMKPNNVELRYMKIQEIKEEIRNQIQEIWLIQKSLDEKNKLIRYFINLIPQKQYIAVLEFTYLKCITANEIAQELSYSCDYVRQAKLRSYNVLADLLKTKLSKKQ